MEGLILRDGGRFTTPYTLHTCLLVATLARLGPLSAAVVPHGARAHLAKAALEVIAKREPGATS